MQKSTKLIVAMALMCFAIMAFNSDRALGQTEHETMIWRLKQIVLMLKGQVLPRLGSVPKTGQTTSYATGDDGDLQMGTAWPVPRFADNGDGTVTDNMTGLMWLKDANCISTNYPEFDDDGTLGDGRVTWNHALDFVAGINDGTYSSCGGGYSDWRLPNRKELESLIHLGFYNPCVPDTGGKGQWSEGDPFTNLQPSYYWSATTFASVTGYAWFVGMCYGGVYSDVKSIYLYVWPVRAGQ